MKKRLSGAVVIVFLITSLSVPLLAFTRKFRLYEINTGVRLEACL